MEMVDGTMIDTSDKQLSPDAVLYAYPGMLGMLVYEDGRWWYVSMKVTGPTRQRPFPPLAGASFREAVVFKGVTRIPCDGRTVIYKRKKHPLMYRWVSGRWEVFIGSREWVESHNLHGKSFLEGLEGLEPLRYEQRDEPQTSVDPRSPGATFKPIGPRPWCVKEAVYRFRDGAWEYNTEPVMGYPWRRSVEFFPYNFEQGLAKLEPYTVATEKPPLGCKIIDDPAVPTSKTQRKRERWQEWAESAEAELLAAYDEIEELNEQLDALTAAHQDITAHYEELLGSAALKGELAQARRTNLADYVVCSRDGGTEVWLCWQAPSGRWWRRRPDRNDWRVCSSPVGRRGWSTWRAVGALDEMSKRIVERLKERGLVPGVPVSPKQGGQGDPGDIVKMINESIAKEIGERFQEMVWRQVARPVASAPVQGDPGDEQPMGATN